MSSVLKIGQSVLLIALGIVFFISGYSKLLSAELFEIQLVEFGFSNWFLSKYLARILLAYEFFLSFLLIFHVKVKKVTLPLSIFTLLGFTVFVIYQLLIVGETENCGCFGELIKFSYSETVLKNGIMLLVAVGLWKFGEFRDWVKPKYIRLVLIGIFIISLTGVIIRNPPFDIYGQTSAVVVEVGSDLPTIVKTDSTTLDESFYQGSKLLVFASPTCKYCKQVAVKMKAYYPIEENRDKVMLIFSDIDDVSIESFYEQTGIQFNHIKIGRNKFLAITKGRFPQLVFLKDGVVTHNVGKQEFYDKDFPL